MMQGKITLHLIRAGQEAGGALSEAGKRQVAALNRHLIANPMYGNDIWCSTRPEAKETLDGLREGLRLGSSDALFDERLRKIESKPGERRANLPEVGTIEWVSALNFDYPYPESECPTQAGMRMHHWFHEAIRRNPAAGIQYTIVAITHASAIRPLLHTLLELPRVVTRELQLDHTSVTSLRWIPNRIAWEIRRLNATPHLPHTSW